jgi:hypothetical protein
MLASRGTIAANAKITAPILKNVASALLDCMLAKRKMEYPQLGWSQ